MTNYKKSYLIFNKNTYLFLMYVIVSVFLTSCDKIIGDPPVYVEGDKYEIGCSCRVTEAPFDAWLIGIRDTGNSYICNTGEPTRDAQRIACAFFGGNLNEDSFRSGYTGVRWSCEATSAVLYERGSCYHAEGLARISAPLSSSDTSSGNPITIDESFSLIQRDNKADIIGQINRATVNVSVKFLRSRRATTTAKGEIYFEGGLCDIGEECPIILKYLNLDFADFNIVRPTRLARDVKIRNAQMYTPNPVTGIRKSDGKIKFPRAKLLFTGIVDGDKKVAVGEIENSLSGSMNLVKDRSRGIYTFSDFYIDGNLVSGDGNVSTRMKINVLSSELLPDTKISSNCDNLRACVSFTISDQNTLIPRNDELLSREWRDNANRLLSNQSEVRVTSKTNFPIRLHLKSRKGRSRSIKVDKPNGLLDSNIILPNPRIPGSPVIKPPEKRY